MSGVTYDYMEEYIRSLIPDSTGKFNELEEFAKEKGVPIAQKETIKFLEFMVSMKKPIRILELGTAIGYSAILMYDAAGTNPHITTIERSEEMIELAKKNIKNPTLKYLSFKNLGIDLFLDNLNLFPNIFNICPLPQYLLQYFFPPPKIEISNGIKKHNKPSHANKILNSPRTKYNVETIHI